MAATSAQKDTNTALEPADGCRISLDLRSCPVIVCKCLIGIASGGGPAKAKTGLFSTVCGLEASLSVIVTDPVRTPAALGVKVMVIRQVELAARVLPQVLFCAKSPLASTPKIVSGLPPVFAFVSVTI